MVLRRIQLGKNWITDNFIETLRSNFQSTQSVKISVLRSFCRDKEHLKENKDEILDKLGKNFTAKIIGYTLAVKKWRRNIREWF